MREFETKIKIAKSNKQWVGTYEKTRVNKMDMDKTEKNQEKFTCGEFEYQVIRSARKTMTLEVRRDGNVIVRAPLRTGLPRIKRFVNQKQDWVLECLERTKEYREQKPLSADLSEAKRNVYIRKSKRNDYQKNFIFCQTHGRFLPQYHHQRTENKMGKL
mgnify:CR=1 FL=1